MRFFHIWWLPSVKKDEKVYYNFFEIKKKNLKNYAVSKPKKA